MPNVGLIPQESVSGLVAALASADVSDLTSHYAPRLANWFRGGISGKKLAIVGDSTSDQTGNAPALYTELGKYATSGDVLSGVTIADFGSNGQTAAGFLASRGSAASGKNYPALVAADPDLIVLSYGINDVRLGATNQAQLITTLTGIVDALRTDLPLTDIVLRIPNGFSQQNSGANNYVTTSGGTIVDQTSNSNGMVAQTYTDILYYAYKELEGLYPGVVLLDIQSAVSGRTAALTTATAGLSDQIHPTTQTYEGIGRAIVAAVAPPDPVKIAPKTGFLSTGFSQAMSDRAVSIYAASPGTAWTPWAVYPRVLEDPALFDVVAEGRLVAAPGLTNFVISGSGWKASQIAPGDIALFYDDQAVWVTTSSTGLNVAASSTSGATSSITVAYTSGQGPTTASATGLVRVFRRKYYGDASAQFYAQAAGTYQSVWKARVVAAGNGFLYLTPFESPVVPAYNRIIRAGDIIIGPGQTVYTVQSGDSIGYASGYPQITGSGTNFSAWSGLYGVYVVSSRIPDTHLKAQEVIALSTTPGSTLVVSATAVLKRIVTRPGRYNTVFAKLGTAGSGGSTVSVVKVNGTTGLTLTFATGSTTAAATWASGSQIYLTPNDVVSLEVTTVNGTPSDLTVALDNN